MQSNKPYLLRAFFDWMVDNQTTPLLVVDATYPRCNVPEAYIENGEIILNIAPDAIRDLKITNHLVEFKASFSGIAHLISVPVKAVLAIYTEENGQGMFFDGEDVLDDDGSSDWSEEESSISSSNSEDIKQPRKSHLKLVE